VDRNGCDVDRAGCSQLVSSSIRPTSVVVTSGRQIGYVDHTGCGVDHNGCYVDHTGGDVDHTGRHQLVCSTILSRHSPGGVGDWLYGPYRPSP
jgi:hypothetical protein